MTKDGWALASKTKCFLTGVTWTMSMYISMLIKVQVSLTVESTVICVTVILPPVMQAAETLKERLWGQELTVLEILDHEGKTWQYMSKSYLDSLKMDLLGYPADGLLIRQEYKAAFDELTVKAAQPNKGGGVVVTGQPGIGKSLC